MPALTEITTDQLLRLIGVPDAPAILDVRTDDDFDDDPHVIPAARRIPHDAVAASAEALRGRRVVVVCHRGLKLSHGAAALLRCAGVAAEHLRGGMVAWRDAGAPCVPAARIPARAQDGTTRWVARHRPKIDHIACPWLVRRFVDPSAQFLFVAPNVVLDVADRFAATPFDVEGVFWSHHGARCTFDAMLDAFGLESPALRRMATIIRAADVGRLDDAPEAAGLLALSVGLSRAYRDDLAQMEAGFIFYDALYRWARDGHGEKHGWPNPGG